MVFCLSDSLGVEDWTGSEPVELSGRVSTIVRCGDVVYVTMRGGNPEIFEMPGVTVVARPETIDMSMLDRLGVA